MKVAKLLFYFSFRVFLKFAYTKNFSLKENKNSQQKYCKTNLSHLSIVIHFIHISHSR